MTTWITITQAMDITGRSRPTIYRWIQQGRIRSRRRTIDDVLVLDGIQLTEVEPTITRGRPIGSARPNTGDRVSH